MTQQNSICRLCGDRDKTINHIKSECAKLVQKEYKSRQNWGGKVIHWELDKKLNFDNTNKSYMHIQASLQENETHKYFRDFEIQTDLLNSARRPDLMIINKEKDNLQHCWLCGPGWPQSEIERKWNEG